MTTEDGRVWFRKGAGGERKWQARVQNQPGLLRLVYFVASSPEVEKKVPACVFALVPSESASTRDLFLASGARDLSSHPSFAVSSVCVQTVPFSTIQNIPRQHPTRSKRYVINFVGGWFWSSSSLGWCSKGGGGCVLRHRGTHVRHLENTGQAMTI